MFLHSLRRQRLPLARWPLHRFIATKNVVADPMTGEFMPSTPDIQVRTIHRAVFIST
jgi:hypothetical protein